PRPARARRPGLPDSRRVGARTRARLACARSASGPAARARPAPPPCSAARQIELGDVLQYGVHLGDHLTAFVLQPLDLAAHALVVLAHARERVTGPPYGLLHLRQPFQDLIVFHGPFNSLEA